MNLDDLEKLADAAMSPAPYEREQGQADLKAVGVPQTIKQLIALCRQLHHQLDLADIIISDEYPEAQLDEFYGRKGRHKALAAFDAFNGRE